MADNGRLYKIIMYVACIISALDITSCADETECYENHGAAYRGTYAVTVTGESCLIWKTEWILNHPAMGLEGGHNYCRNPDNDNAPWCFTDDDQSYGYCSLPQCSTEVTECYEGNGNTYRGTYAKTDTGAPCQNWTDEHVEHYPGQGLAPDHNYCRNPDNDSQPWCSTGDGGEYDFCSFLQCPRNEKVLECYEGNGNTYRGTYTKTNTGVPCQNWTVEHVEHYPGQGLAPDHNYCRNPDNNSQPWCSTGEGGEHAYCSFLQCVQLKEDCYWPDDNGISYRGTLSVNNNGVACVSWTYNQVDFYPDAGISVDHNYCRNPDNRERPWCRTDFENLEWSFCDLPECNPEYDAKECMEGDGFTYRGTRAVTETGTRCKKWSEYNIPITNRGLEGNNYCRNPNHDVRPWCMVDETSFEFCIIPMCNAIEVNLEHISRDLITGEFTTEVPVKDCMGIRCLNGGTLGLKDYLCYCWCQAAYSGVYCEYKLQPSMWPDGPYVIAMPSEGCPETQSQGWRSGYIHLQSKIPLNITIVTDVHIDSTRINTTKISSTHFVDDIPLDIALLGPYERSLFRLNFCYKEGDHPFHTTNRWPSGAYGILATPDGCPQGFTEEIFKLKIPELMYWNTDGHLPYFNINVLNNGKGVLKFQMCKNVNNTDTAYNPAFSYFVLLKIKETKCPFIPGFEMKEIAMTIQSTTDNTDNSNSPNQETSEIGYCYFRPVYRNNMKVDDNHDCNDTSMENTAAYGKIIKFDGFELPTGVMATWYQLNLQRTLKVSGIVIELSTVETALSELEDILAVFISNEQRSFRSHGALTCHYNSYSYVTRNTRFFQLQLIRIQEGKYVSLFNRDTTRLPISTFGVNACNKNTVLPRSCRRELGLNDRLIEDFQITASSWQAEYTPNLVRSFQSGWCASTDDPDPFLQIDLLSPTMIEGLLVDNWYKVVVADEVTHRRTTVAMGSGSLYISYGNYPNVTELYNNEAIFLLAGPETQTVLFLRPFLARYIRLYPKDPLNTDAVCLRIELLGCRKNDGVKLGRFYEKSTCQIKRSAEMFTTFTKPKIKINVTEQLRQQGHSINETGLVDQRLACENICLNTIHDCYAVELTDNGVCDVFTHRETKYYHVTKSEENTKNVSLLICLTYSSEVDLPLQYKTPYNTVRVTDDAVITNAGYPFHYPTDQIYKWNITFDPYYVSVMFSNISLHVYEDMDSVETCKDTIQLSINSITFDYRFNGRTPSIPTDQLTILMTFTTCSRHGARIHSGHGFRAILQKKYSGTCITTVPPWYGSHRCFEIVGMDIVSMSFLGMEEDEVTEEIWEIITPGPGDVIIFYVIDFYVRCDTGSSFEIQDYNKEAESYCNLRKPKPSRISLSDKLTIRFNFKPNADSMKYVEGFKASYDSRRPYRAYFSTFEGVVESTSYFDWLVSSYNKEYLSVACSKLFNKCYYFYPAFAFSWKEASQICASRGFTLVAIQSALELNYIKSLLVRVSHQQVYEASWDVYKHLHRAPPTELSWISYIGLYHYVGSDGQMHQQWEDGSIPTFTAWDADQPADVWQKQCTYFGFSENKENSWKTIPCTYKDTFQMSWKKYDYLKSFVCQHHGLQNNDANIPRDQQVTFRSSVVSEINVLIHQCGSGEWIHISNVCDGIPECLDKSDELNCVKRSTGDTSTCAYEEFRCDGGRCIHISLVCNFLQDCGDGSDEFCAYTGCAAHEFQCDNGQCIAIGKRCNALYDCHDNSDELFCDLGSCDPTTFQCGDLSCIPLSAVCDTFPDCVDSSDEQSCHDVKYTTCKQLYDVGYRKEGTYTIAGMEVTCKFEEDQPELKVVTTITNIDRSVNIDTNNKKEMLLEVPLGAYTAFPDWKNCNIKVSKQCWPHVERIADFDDVFRNNSYKTCECEFWYSQFTPDFGRPGTTPFLFQGDWKSPNNTYRVDCEYTEYVDISSYKYFEKLSNASLFDNTMVRWIDNRVRCSQTYPRIVQRDDLSFECKEEKRFINRDERCLYDLDMYGYIIGCRSMSHLQNCEQFECPADYFKCPLRFCLAVRFVCDGIHHCPGGEDEHNCWCEDNDNTIAVIYHGDINIDTRSYIRKLAKQFSASVTVLVHLTLPKVSETVADIDKDGNTVETIMVKIKRTYLNDGYTAEIKNVMSIILEPRPALESVEIKATHLKEYVLVHLLNGTKTGMIYVQDTILSESVRYLMNAAFELNAHLDDHVYLYRVLLDQHMQDISNTSLSSGNVTDIKVRNWNVLGTIGSTLFVDICQESSRAACTNGYRCGKSRVCIPLQLVCDGQTQCMYGDDEMHCGFKAPDKCNFTGYAVDCQNRNLTSTDLLQLSTMTRSLDLSQNKLISNTFFENANIPFLIKLNLSMCSITMLYGLSNMKQLISLDISYNAIDHIKENTFLDAKFLADLYLRGNYKMKFIEARAFVGLVALRRLSITETEITRILPNTFIGLTLDKLTLSSNLITQVDDLAFNGLQVAELDLQHNIIEIFNNDMFTGILALKYLYTSAFKFCCIRPGYVDENKCLPHKDEFSSCDDLMRNSALQTLMWLVGVSAFIGNIASLIFRLIFDRERLKLGYGIFVTNLAVADLLMGVYLLIIAIADLLFRKRYILMDEYWRNSFWCNFAGVLSTVSSEASIFFICLITVDRILVIKYPFGQVRFRSKSAVLLSLVIWMITLGIAALPLIYTSYFRNKFYTKSGVCLALPLTSDRPPGWQYSISIFVGFNFLTFVLIAAGQFMIYSEVQKSSKFTKNASKRQNELKIARNLLLVVSTDFLCWFPIGCMGFMALGGYVISGDVYAWTAVLILPINSALNPFLYTLSVILGQRKFMPDVNEQERLDTSRVDRNHVGFIWNNRYLGREGDHLTTNSAFISMNDVIQREIPMSVRETTNIVVQVARCVSSLHRRNVTHGQLSESNLFISYREDNKTFGDIKLMMKASVFTTYNAKTDDIHSMGCLFRKLIRISQPKRNGIETT